MKAIHFSSCVLEGFTSKKDKSLSLRFSTPELADEEAVAVRALQGVVSDMLVQPQDEEFPEIVEVKAQTEQKTASSRLRGSLFVLWEKRGKEGDFDLFYRTNMEKFITRIKNLIDEEAQ